MYKLYDIYDFERELLGSFEEMCEVRNAARDREADTDGECKLMLIEVDENGKREVVNEWSY